DIVAYMLSQNGIAAGSIKLAADGPMSRVLVIADAGAESSAQTVSTAEVQLGALSGPVKQPTTSRPTQAELDAGDPSRTNWLMYNKGYRGERYSELKQLNARTASRLRPVCVAQLGELGTFQAGPVVYDGVLYATTHLGTYAIDAKTCRKRWSHQHVARG